MTDLVKYKIGRYLYAPMFWIPIAVLYFQYRGFDLSTMYIAVSTNTILQVIFEYPTGVIGDYLGHRISVALGYFLTGLAFILLSFSLPLWAYFIIFGIMALGGAFVSGSDIALLYSISKEFKKDSATISSISGIIFSISLVIGGLIGQLSLSIPMFLAGLTTFIGAIFISLIKNRSIAKKEEDSIWIMAKRGFVEVNTNGNITFLIYSSSVFMMYLLSQKWIITPVFERDNIPVIFYGIIIASMSLCRSQAGFIYRKFGYINNWILIVAFIILSFIVSFSYVAIPALFMMGLIIGYYQVQADIIISENVDSSVRASSLSYRGLLNKLLETVFLLCIGSILLGTNFAIANVYATGIIFILIIFSSLIPIIFSRYKK